MAEEPVDVLIVGAGASGAAIAWSLADTRMRIVCMEQGDWVNPTDYPSNTRDWESRSMGEYSICLLYTSPSPRDGLLSRMPSSA